MNIKRDISLLFVLISFFALVLYFDYNNERKKSEHGESPVPASSIEDSNTETDNTKAEDETMVITAKMNNPGSGLGVVIEPLELIEDSRCPSDVVCIQAGTVRVRVKITDPNGERIVIMDLGMPLSSQYETVQLAEVLPEARSTIPIRMNEYRFIFEIRMQVRF